MKTMSMLPCKLMDVLILMLFASVFTMRASACTCRLGVQMPQSFDVYADPGDNRAFIKSVPEPVFTGDPSDCDPYGATQVGGPRAPGYFQEGYNYLVYRILIKDSINTDYFHVTVKVVRCATPLPMISYGAKDCYSQCSDNSVNGASCTYLCNEGYRSPQIVSRFTCNNGQWNPVADTFQCIATDCGEPLKPDHGSWTCPKNYTYRAQCFLSCDPGYGVRSFSAIICQTNGLWSHQGFSFCKDLTPPTFVNESVFDLVGYAGLNNAPGTVTWTDPVAIDMPSGSRPSLSYRSNSYVQFSSTLMNQTSAAFPVGVNTVTVLAEDDEGNVAAIQFKVTIKAVPCQDPHVELNTTASLYFWPNPSGPVAHGVMLNVYCQRDVRMAQQGARSILCVMDSNTHVANWTWGPGNELGMKPNCIAVPCPPLNPPINGALECFEGTAGRDCLMSCNDKFDVAIEFQALSISRFSCPLSRPQWYPPQVPDCTEKHSPKSARVHATINFYFSGNCFNNTDALRQAFLDRVLNSRDRDLCFEVPACRKENIEVICGESTTRRRRETERSRRAVADSSVEIIFDLVIEQPNISLLEMNSFVRNLSTLLDQITAGNASDILPGLTYDRSISVSPKITCDCQPGTACSPSLTCLGCSSGYFMKNGTQECAVCPINTYQNQSGSLTCIPCPVGTSTKNNASTSIDMCKSPQAGDWGMWSLWSDCSATCGGGQQNRQRRCDSPAPEPGGLSCAGDETETRNCSTVFCAVDGAWGNWISWSQCNVSCGGGETTRTRQCDSPAPQHGGLQCIGLDREIKACAVNLCPVDGGWGQWGDWTQCSASCGGGVQSRSRLCDSPPPSPAGGKNCAGLGKEMLDCNNHTCPYCPLTFDRPENALEPVVTVADDVRNCSIQCQPGHVWAMSYQPYFYCGPQTNFNWSISPIASVSFEPPFCDVLQPTTGGSAQFSIPISHPCLQDQSTINSVVQQVESKMTLLPCKKVVGVTEECLTTVSVACEGVTSNNVTRVRRSVNQQLTLIVEINGQITTNGGNLTQGTPEYDRYMRIMKAIQDSIDILLKGQNDLYALTIDGDIVQAQVDNITANGQYHCPPGTSFTKVSCTRCTAGMYETGGNCLFCPVGQYQDEAGSVACKDCPSGLTTDYIGAVNVVQCQTTTNARTTPSEEVKNKESSISSTTVLAVAVGTSVGVVAAIVLAAGIYFMHKRIRKTGPTEMGMKEKQ